MRKYVAEFVGTFFLVFTICLTGRAGAALAALAIGAVLTAVVYATGHISGGHVNPAVTLAVFLRGRIPARDIAPYWLAQVLGALAAAGLARFIINAKPVPVTASGHDLAAAFIAELVFTVALAFVVLNVATSRDHPDNSFYGLAIGFIVLAGAVAVGHLSGGAFNPAVGIGICLAGLASWSMLWVYVVATLAGAAGAGLAFRALNPDDVGPAVAYDPAADTAAPRTTTKVS